MKRLLLLALPLFFALPANADSVNTFALQGTTRVYLTTDSNPLLTTSSPGNGPWDALLFVTLIPNGDYTITYTLDIGNLHFTSSGSGPCIDCAYSQAFLLPGFPNPTQGFLTVDLNGNIQKYAFRFSAVPEPTSLLLLGTGVVVLGWRKYRLL